ncbi:MAG: hypothetical protein PWR09_1116, partial [Archaeoglobi archaeon]|nr:hypothetical protein [Archaeoglobi archaeon]
MMHQPPRKIFLERVFILSERVEVVFRSYEIAKIRGISILLHPSFVIFIALLILAFYLSGGGFYAIAGALYLIFLFSFVVFHELAHSMTAKSYGINVRKITLLPIGGVAELERYPKDPKAELRIAAAGPLSNFLLASLFFLLLHILNLSISYSSLGGIPELLDIRALLIMGIQVNLALGLFNLIPAFPMDGGRILRALLARRMSLVEATERASRIARIIAILMFVFGLFYIPF